MHTLIDLVDADRSRLDPASRVLTGLLTDIANAASQSGDSEYMLAKRLDRILTSPRGEGRSVREEFLLLSDACHAGLLTWLAEQYPDLTRNELALCGMIALGLDPLCIGKILGYDHEQTFYNKRADIRKKLQIERSVSLEGFLREQAAVIRRGHDDLLGHFRRLR